MALSIYCSTMSQYVDFKVTWDHIVNQPCLTNTLYSSNTLQTNCTEHFVNRIFCKQDLAGSQNPFQYFSHGGGRCFANPNGAQTLSEYELRKRKTSFEWLANTYKHAIQWRDNREIYRVGNAETTLCDLAERNRPKKPTWVGPPLLVRLVVRARPLRTWSESKHWCCSTDDTCTATVATTRRSHGLMTHHGRPQIAHWWRTLQDRSPRVLQPLHLARPLGDLPPLASGKSQASR